MKHNVSELEGALLDAAVALTEGLLVERAGDDLFVRYDPEPWLAEERPPPYSTEWQHGGPIIERKRIAVMPHYDEWVAHAHAHVISRREVIDQSACEFGDTPLIAAMRACVASEYGEEIELPESLTK